MTTPKVSTVKAGGSRFYVHPDTDQKVPGVTSVLNMLPKPFLEFWASKLVAETAVDNVGSWIGLAVSGQREAAIDYLKKAPLRNTGKAADTGTAAHDLFERLASGERLGKREVSPDLVPFVNHFREWWEIWQPEFLHLERTVWSASVGYAGTFDAIATVKPGGEAHNIIIDWKTTRSGVHPEVALQLTAYSRADYIIGEGGEQVPLPQIDGAAVLHVRPEGWQFVPASISDELFNVFKALLVVTEWDKTTSKTVIGKPLAP